ncbi:hypothetical protein [Pontibacillus litoralis]|uniref:Uncharacterized protein n=1 Tax=Pontibacillus litoralis JSM 072002 TaxID=1385512 RepID=A0A0A5GAQ0_9BACI|nr:hypothetical protein [Pontibacillus litoralis]KGX88273.1 hypothetical protein N784_10850 [Pontibacillus litoralis JSM 072002]
MKDKDSTDWWHNYLEVNRQENELEASIEFFKQYLAHCYAVQPLSEKHRDIINKLEHSFDGKANQVLIKRFEENQIDLMEIDRMYEGIYENIRLRSWF